MRRSNIHCAYASIGRVFAATQTSSAAPAMAHQDREALPDSEPEQQLETIMLSVQARVGVAAQSAPEVEHLTVTQPRVLVLLASRGRASPHRSRAPSTRADC